LNQFLDNRYIERIDRLALGLEPVDAQRLHRVARPLSIDVERPPKAVVLPPAALNPYAIGPKPPKQRPQVRLDRHASCLHVLLYYPALVDTVDIRIYESLREFVPRRFTIPLHTAATVDNFAYTDRVRRPFLYPGAAYDPDSCSTGIRGRVLRGGQPMRWARIEATLPGTTTVVGRAHGDDRGEFLLLIGTNAIPIGDLVNPLTLQVTVHGPATIPVPVPPSLASQDQLWDLPLETPPAPGVTDMVSSGESLPVNYTANSTTNIDFNLGELRSGLAAFTIT
jgi:hypothetical protein